MLLRRNSRAARNTNSWKRKWTRWVKKIKTGYPRVFAHIFRFYFLLSFISFFSSLFSFLFLFSFSFPLFLWPWRGRVVLQDALVSISIMFFLCREYVNWELSSVYAFPRWIKHDFIHLSVKISHLTIGFREYSLSCSLCACLVLSIWGYTFLNFLFNVLMNFFRYRIIFKKLEIEM